MPIRLADIYKDSKTVTFEYDNEKVTVEYRHKKLTPVNRVALMAGSEFFHERKPAAKPSKGRKGQDTGQDNGLPWRDVMDGNERYYGLLAEILVGWDVLDEEGQPLPVTVEWLEMLPQDFLSEMIAALITDGRANPTKGENSPGT